jgi:hypothetical protein
VSELSDVLLELRDVGIEPLPETGDAGDGRLRDALAQGMARKRSRRPAWTRRRIRVGGFAVPPLAALAVVATAAAATAAAVTLSATNLFQINPQGNPNGIETVLPSTVTEIGNTAIPSYGTVQFWGATTQQGGFCFALKLPDGSWGGYPGPASAAGDPYPLADGWDGGTPPGCVVTRQQEVVEHEGASHMGLEPEPLEVFDETVMNNSGQAWDIYVGFVTAQGTAASIHDPLEDLTEPVMSSGYYIFSEPSPHADQVPGWTAHPTRGPVTPGDAIQPGSAGGFLRVLDANGNQLQPDYTFGSLLPQYSFGPTQG